MDKKNKQAVSSDDDDDDILSSTDTVVSSTECTGLIQTPPDSEPEAESYTDLYTIPKPVKEKHKGTQHE